MARRNIGLRYTLEYNTNLAAWPVRTFRDAIQVALQRVGEWWHAKRLREHFRTGARDKYGYQERKESYKTAKRRTGMSGELDLIGKPRKNRAPGQTKRMMMSAAVIRATRGSVTVRMRAPWYVKDRGRSGRGPDKVAELVRLSPDELKEIDFMVRETLSDELAKRPMRQRKVRA